MAYICVLSVKLQIDFLVNNAGILQMGLLMDCDFDVVFPVLNTNVLGTISLTKAVLPHMVRNRNGQIVVISSASGKSGKFDIIIIIIKDLYRASILLISHGRGERGYK